MSREKGLAGMAENVRQGYRAGGRAPLGYRLELIPAGAIRDGEPVTKSKLVPSDLAPKIGAYLKGRANGSRRLSLAKELGLDLSSSTIHGIEWNALTYAGHTVWNVHNETTKDGYVGGVKRRPREESVIQKDTHQPLITDAEAESILERLKAGKQTTYKTKAKHLLTGMLVTEEGDAWHGNGNFYRAGKRSVKAERVDAAVLAHISSDLQSAAFIKSLTANARKAGQLTDDDAEGEKIRSNIKKLDAKINRLSDLLSETTASDTLIRKIEEFAEERDSLNDQLAKLEITCRQSKAMREIQEPNVKAMLSAMADNLPDLDRDALKDLLRGLVERITLNHPDLACCIHYKIKLPTGELVASPGGFDQIPQISRRVNFQMSRIMESAKVA